MSYYGEREYKGAAERLRQDAHEQGAKAAIHNLYETHAEKTAAGQDNRGCLLCSACTERAAQDQEVKKLVEHYIAVLQAAIAEIQIANTMILSFMGSVDFRMFLV